MRERKAKRFGAIRSLFHKLVVAVGAVALTMIFFLVLPLMQTLTQGPQDTLVVTSVDTALPPPPPPPPEEEPEEEEEEPEEKPELEEQPQRLDLSQLETALNQGLSEGVLAGDFAMSLKTVTGGSDEINELFSSSELDQQPRAIHQPPPSVSPGIKKQVPGTVYVIFIVNQDGRVEKPMVQKSSHPVFEKSALAAVKQWKFEPGQKDGKPVSFRMRVPITYPEELGA